MDWALSPEGTDGKDEGLGNTVVGGGGGRRNSQKSKGQARLAKVMMLRPSGMTMREAGGGFKNDLVTPTSTWALLPSLSSFAVAHFAKLLPVDLSQNPWNSVSVAVLPILPAV